jgi:hypothetical protein
MLRRLIIVLIVMMPLAAQADDATSQTPTQSSSSLQQTADSASVPQTLNLLQPANADSSSTALQSADATGGGVTQSTTQDLQQTGTSDQVNLLVQGDADQPHPVGSGSGVTWLGYAAIVLLVATAVTAVAWLVQRRRIF